MERRGVTARSYDRWRDGHRIPVDANERRDNNERGGRLQGQSGQQDEGQARAGRGRRGFASLEVPKALDEAWRVHARRAH